MRFLLGLTRIIVGGLFIFSGLIKANDPQGLSYKMQEFFEILGMGFLDDYTLIFSILMIAFEIIAGVAVLLGQIIAQARHCYFYFGADQFLFFLDPVLCAGTPSNF